jgi:hypothetical protein
MPQVVSRRLKTQVFGVIGSKHSGLSLCVATAAAIFLFSNGLWAEEPKPKLNDVILAGVPPVDGKPVTIMLRGRVLSADADFKISYKEQADGPETEVALTPDRLDPTEQVKGEELDEQSKPDKTYKKLTIKVMKADPKWFLNGKIVISNPDGQIASWPLPKDETGDKKNASAQA